MLAQNQSVDGLRCPTCGINTVPESHRICDQCDAEKTVPFTDAQLQARVDELEALISKVVGSNSGSSTINTFSTLTSTLVSPQQSDFDHDDCDFDEVLIDESEYDNDDDLELEDDDGDFDDDRTRAETEDLDDGRTANDSVHRRSLSLQPLSINSSIDVDIPEEVKEHLLSVFFKHIFQFNFYKPLPLFQASLDLPSWHPDAPHPVLLNSIYLVTLQFSPRVKELQIYVPRLMRTTLDLLVNDVGEELSLASPGGSSPSSMPSVNVGGMPRDRPLDFIMAAVLFSRFCWYSNRFDYGVHFTNSAMSFGVGCGLHRVDVHSYLQNNCGSTDTPSSQESASSYATASSHYTSPLSSPASSACLSAGELNGAGPSSSGGLGFLPPPKSEEEAIQRIRLWHSIFILDRGAAWTSGVPSFLGEEDVITPWPLNSLRSGARLEQLLAFQTPQPTLPTLLSSANPSASHILPGDTALSIRVKAMVFLERSAYFARRAEAGDYLAKSSPATSPTSSTSTATPTTATPYTNRRSVHPDVVKQTSDIPSGNDTPVYMLNHSGTPESEMIKLEPAFFNKFGELESALRTFAATLPQLTAQDLDFEVTGDDSMALDDAAAEFNDIDVWGEEPGPSGTVARAHSSRTHTLAFGHSMAQASLVQIYAILSDYDPRVRRLMVECALKTTQLIHLVRRLETEYFQVLLVPWAIAAQVLLNHLLKIHSSGDNSLQLPPPESGEEIITVGGLRIALAIAIQGLRKLNSFYPITHVYLNRMQQGLDTLGIEA